MKWRDEERKKNMKRTAVEDEKEAEDADGRPASFIRPMLNNITGIIDSSPLDHSFIQMSDLWRIVSRRRDETFRLDTTTWIGCNIIFSFISVALLIVYIITYGVSK